MPTIHLCDDASQPDIHIRCLDRWTQPAWMQPADLTPHTHAAESGDVYAFDRALVTCVECTKGL